MAQYAEGQKLRGSDGNMYVVRNGAPVRDAEPLAQSPAYPYQGPQAATNLAKSKLELRQQEAQAAADTRIKNAQAIQEEQKASDAALAGGDALGDPKLTGAARLASVPESKRPLVQLLLNNQLQQLGSFSLGKPQLQSLLATAKAINPAFDPSAFNVRNKAMVDFTGEGKGAQAIGTIDRLGANLQTLKSISDQMGGPNVGWGPANAALAAGKESFEPTLRAAYDNLLPEVSNQFDLVMKSNKGTPTVSGTDLILKGMRRQQSQAERDAAFQVAVKAVHGAILPLKAQWDSAYGGGTAPPMWLSPQTESFFATMDPDNASTYNAYQQHSLPGVYGDQAPPLGGPPPPPGGGASPLGGGPNPPPVPTADYSGMTGAPQQSLAGMDPNSPYGVFAPSTREVIDKPVSSALAALAHKRGASFADAAALLQQNGHGQPAFSPDDWNRYVGFAHSHPNYNSVSVYSPVPTTLGQRMASSPGASFAAGAGTGLTAGLSDVAGRAALGPQWDAGRAALAATHPGADLAGNVAGGVGAMAGVGAASDALQLGGRLRMLLGASKARQLGMFAPAATDATYGATYGASEDPNNPLGGAAVGALTGAGGGIGARAAVRGLGNAIAPTGGALAPIFDANPDFRPTFGQRLSASSSRFNRALGMGEQAAESIPFTGGIQTGARSAATDEMQRGAYNSALNDLAPLNPILGRDVSQLPPGVTKGAPANAFLQNAMGDAQTAARSGMRFQVDPQFVTDLGAWQKQPGAMALTNDQVGHVQNVIGKAFNGRIVNGTTMDGPNLAAAVSDLNSVARNWAGSPQTAGQAAYLRDYIGIVDDAAQRASPPEAAAALQAANRGYAKSVILDNAAKSAGGESTEFTGKQLLRAVQNSDPSVRDRAFLRGQALMQPYATAAAKLSPSLADSGTPQRLMWAGLGTGEAGLMGGAAAMGHPMALAPWALDTLANLPGVRNAVGAAMAPRSATLPPLLADPLNVAGRGIYNNATTLGMFGAPSAVSYYSGQ